MSAAPDRAPTRAALLAEGARRLEGAGIEGAARDARLLLRWAAGLDGAALAARLDQAPAPDEAARFREAVAARAARRPLSHITGRRVFWGREFLVTGDVLDPRPETETLIAAALEGGAFARALDLGLGSGCILFTLLAERPGARGVGVEREAAALAVARRNAALVGVEGRARLVQGDWFAPLGDERFDLIVSNPPYIPADEMDALAPEVRLHEPAAALSPGGDGLDAYRALAAGLAAHLAPGGRALFEFGAGQEEAVRAIFAAQGFGAARLHRDMDGRARVIELRAPADGARGQDRT
ncbi:peptide chain release factor N(5)-glutamine methyltransferase [Oceanicella actignis]|uniref:Release factor glutamine methyltransferase n=1 Tax=Oceanicella actignis TaxID=1189325 RepID=A0A1M7S1W8_9RHOB|nr:peptide chain release factor N(5)-glutamine methyltransferase [Oceanicella actignis]TYO90155.1 [protein release factor]-glutamine N5-methyltransferase [Oceanicella actignis]SES90977.1 [protein release factor]-glutamine N5-methyltransferase [Oceanicella actignis]SHN52513.1 release factor glutamine methyltransferase [Oceanicella actignis]